MAGNNSKPYQLEQIRRQGWSTPETLITTDPEAARDFWERHGNVIYKSVSGIRSRVSRLGPEHRERFTDIGSCPTQFQDTFRAAIIGSTSWRTKCLPAKSVAMPMITVIPAKATSKYVPVRYLVRLRTAAANRPGRRPPGHRNRSPPHAGGRMALLRTESVAGLHVL